MDSRTKRKRTQKLIEQQNNICHWCGLPMLPQGRTRFKATLDHLGPKNGEYREAVATHRHCNNARQHEPSLPPKDLEYILSRADHLFRLIEEAKQPPKPYKPNKRWEALKPAAAA